MMKKLMGLLGAAALVLASSGATAQHLHEGDIEVSVVGGKLTVAGNHESEYGTGRQIFEGSLDTLLAGPRYRTTDPGFDSEPGTFAPADLLYFRGWGSLAFWDGDSWESSVPNGEMMVIRDSLDGELTVGTAGLSPNLDFTGFIADGGATGQIHQHLTFTLQRAVSALPAPAVGAYRVGLQLFAEGHTDSDEFYLVLNRGLGDEAFEASVMAMAVPEPETYALMAAGLALVTVVGRRARR